MLVTENKEMSNEQDNFFTSVFTKDRTFGISPLTEKCTQLKEKINLKKPKSKK
jgi:hypothetical protein